MKALVSIEGISRGKKVKCMYLTCLIESFQKENSYTRFHYGTSLWLPNVAFRCQDKQRVALLQLVLNQGLLCLSNSGCLTELQVSFGLHSGILTHFRIQACISCSSPCYRNLGNISLVKNTNTNKAHPPAREQTGSLE